MIYGAFGGLTGVFETRVFYDTDRIDAVFDKLSSGLVVLLLTTLLSSILD